MTTTIHDARNELRWLEATPRTPLTGKKGCIVNRSFFVALAAVAVSFGLATAAQAQGHKHGFQVHRGQSPQHVTSQHFSNHSQHQHNHFPKALPHQPSRIVHHIPSHRPVIVHPQTQVRLVPTTPILGIIGSLQYGQGMLVERVFASTPAADMRLEPGDVIVSINRIPLRSDSDYQYAMQTSGGIVELQVIDVRSGLLVSRSAYLTNGAGPSQVFSAQQPLLP